MKTLKQFILLVGTALFLVPATWLGAQNQMAEAVSKLGGADTGNTRLWWDTGGPNF